MSDFTRTRLLTDTNSGKQNSCLKGGCNDEDGRHFGTSGCTRHGHGSQLTHRGHIEEHTQYIPSTLLTLIAQSYFWTPVMRGKGRCQHEMTTAPPTSQLIDPCSR